MIFYNNKWQAIDRQPCQVYTRVMGYLRPVNMFNIGKKTEFYSRKWFTEEKSKNSIFINKFWTHGQNVNIERRK